jgi:serine/threonine-protein kinase
LPVPSQHGAVPLGFDQWFQRACARLPEQRFTSAREAAHELRRVLTPELLTPQLPSSPETVAIPLVLPPAATERWPALSPAAQQHDHLASTGASSATIQRRPQSFARQTLPLAAALVAGLMLLIGSRFFHATQRIEPAQQIAALAPTGDSALQVGLERAPAIASAALVQAEPDDEPANERAPDVVPSQAPNPPAHRAARGRARAHAAGSRARAERASFTITSTPPSRVLIDGSPKGTTPLRSVRVRPGTHRVTLIHGKQRKTMQVRGGAGETALISARFTSDEPTEAPPNHGD